MIVYNYTDMSVFVNINIKTSLRSINIKTLLSVTRGGEVSVASKGFGINP